jgi:hypothetical protein
MRRIQGYVVVKYLSPNQLGNLVAVGGELLNPSNPTAYYSLDISIKINAFKGAAN